ncbi:MAG: hypothetical protein ABSF08_08955 [Candidatus Cybelea sp.]
MPSLGGENEDIIETVTRVVKKRAKAAPKVYAPHEHFGSPLNVCRICGEKYTYVAKSTDPFGGDKR